MRDSKLSFSQFGQKCSEQVAAQMSANPLSGECQQHFDELSRQSLTDQQQLEKNCDSDFGRYLEEYFAQPI
jgi:hypothetical protein